MPHPNSGRMGRSPLAVPRMSRMLSSISRRPDTSAILRVGSVRSGNAHPEPMKSWLITLSPHPMSTVMTVGMAVPGVRQQVHIEVAVAAGVPPMRTVGLPLTTWPFCSGGARYGSVACRPTCGGTLTPDEPTTAAGLPPMSTVATVPMVIGAENGRGAGEGMGAPTGLGIWWIPGGQGPMIWSPMTSGGAGMSVDLHHRALDLGDRAALRRQPGVAL